MFEKSKPQIIDLRDATIMEISKDYVEACGSRYDQYLAEQISILNSLDSSKIEKRKKISKKSTQLVEK
jgi:hypothetical protein